MEYHSDRFEDYSLLIFKDTKLVGLLPANRVGDTLYSHQGLSYGSFIIDDYLRFKDYVQVFKAVLEYFNDALIKGFYIKELPFIYRGNLSGELDYILSRLDAKSTKVDSYFVFDNKTPYKPNRNRKRALKLAESNNVEVSDKDFAFFWENILTKNLNSRFGVDPVHKFEEIQRLQQNFPERIKYFSASINTEIKAGVVMFITDKVAHFQYSSADESRKETGALDYLFDFIIRNYHTKEFISFGSSATDESLKIDSGLAYWKESFGAKLIPQRTFYINPQNYKKLDAIFR